MPKQIRLRIWGTFPAACLTLCAVLNLAVGTCDAQQPSFYETLLSRRDIEPTAAGLSEYLQQLHPDEGQKAKYLRLIGQLGDEDFFKREEATTKLLILPSPPVEELTAAARGSDPEVRWRAEKILALSSSDSTTVLHAVLKTIAEKKLPGMASDVLKTIPLCSQLHLKNAARQALVETARPEDAQQFRLALLSENLDVRTAAVAALGASAGKEAEEDFSHLIADPEEDERIKLAAARALADMGDRKSLKILTGLMASEDPHIRRNSAATIRALTGKRFSYSAYAPNGERAKAVDLWVNWIDASGQTADLRFPLKNYLYAAGYLNGHTLLAYGNRNQVVELDSSNREIWSYSIRGAWSAEKLANGNVLIASNSLNMVREVNPERQTVWSYEIRNPLNAKQIENGNILIAAFSAKQVIEVNRNKEIVWQYSTPNGFTDAHRLPNGNTLVSAYNMGVLELTPEKQIVWQYSILQPYGVQPLPDGNVLISDLRGKKVIEVTREKEIVWTFPETSPVDAFRLPNGNTLVTSSRRFVEVTRDLQIVWEKAGCSYGTARR